MDNIKKPRVASIDLVRGIIMIIMAIDHVRDYLFAGSFLYDPLDLSKTNSALFFTRWITHLCAPIFMLLAGTSAYLNGQKKSKAGLSLFLLKRGLWLVFVELIIVNFGWNFNITFPMYLFITIWALGISMIVLAGLIFIPKKMVLCICILLIAGHDLFDGFHITGNSLPAFGWSLLHEQRPFTWHGRIFLVGYPLIPLIAVMPLGYCLGNWYSHAYDSLKRQKNLLILGCSMILLFALIRYFNIYGDPVKWSIQENSLLTFLSFMKVNKYPPSLLYLLITLGIGFLMLTFSERWKGRAVEILSVYGRVPMFYYIIHIYVIHAIAMFSSAFITGQDWHIWILTKPIWFTSDLKGYGFSLPAAYCFWIAVVVALYPLCKRYDKYKQANKHKWWLSYL
jgi:uncharacterized membrane protein